MRASAPTSPQGSARVQRSTRVVPQFRRSLRTLEAMMNKPDSQQHAQNAGPTQDLAAASKHVRAPVAPATAEPGTATVSMGSPAFGLDGRPVSKDAIHLST